MTLPKLRPRQPLVGVALAGMAGIALADRWPTNPWYLLGAIVALAVCLIRWTRAAICWAIAALAFAALHCATHYDSPGRNLAEQLTTPRVVNAEGVVVSEPEKPQNWSRTVTAHFRVRLERLDMGQVSGPAAAVVQVRWAGDMPAFGDRVQLRGTAQNIPPPRNPGQFDYRAYCQREGVYSEIAARYPTDCQILEHGVGNQVLAFALTSRRWIREQLALDLSDDPGTADLIASMVLGMRGETPDEVQNMFRATGTLHLFAVSGLNVAMLATLTWLLLKPLRVSRRAAVFVTVPLLAFYAIITGLSASCVRASVMGTLLVCGILFDRRPVLFNSLGAAALAILAWDTNQLFVPGFQFSFVLVVAIAALAGRVDRRLRPLGQPDEYLPRTLWNWRQRAQAWVWNQCAGSAGVTLAAWAGSLTFTAGYFHLFSPAGILANFAAVPIAFAVLALGLMSVVAATVSTKLAVLFNNANWLCTKALVVVIGYFARLPGGHVYTEAPSFPVRCEAEFTVLDLGEGGAIYLREGNEDWLVDCGHRFEYERIVLPYLRSRGVNALSALVLTHGDAQHIGAAGDVWKDLRPEAIFDSPLKDRSQTRRLFHQALGDQKIGKRFLARGDVAFTRGGMRLEVLYPPAGLQRSSADDKALVLRFRAAGCSVLLMSDSGFSTEQWLIQNEPDLHADVLAKGWHGRDASGTEDFIRRVHPQAVIAGQGLFGSGTSQIDQWEQQIAGMGITVLRQDHAGAVRGRIYADGSFDLSSFATGAVFKATARP